MCIFTTQNPVEASISYMEAVCGQWEQTLERWMAQMHNPDSPLNSGPGLTLGVLLAKCFWIIQQSLKAAPFHPPSLKEELWLNINECNFILGKKRHNTLNKGYWNRNTFITKSQKNKNKNNFTLC